MDRGFANYGEFKDAEGKRIRLKESSADPLTTAHLFVDGGREVGNEYLQPSPTLNVRQALELIKALTRFVDHKLETSHDKPLTKK